MAAFESVLSEMRREDSGERRWPLRILVLCTGNSCRSQMAEAFLRHYGGDAVEVESAGSDPTGVHPLTIRALHEVGIDISGARSKHLAEFTACTWDYVITVCDSAAENCPLFPGPARRLHWPFDDPPRAPGSPDAQFEVFRRVRDEIERTVREWLGSDVNAVGKGAEQEEL